MTRRPLLLALDLLVGLSAIAGGAVLIADPTGGTMGFPPGYLVRSPFHTYLAPGFVLALVVGGSALIASVAHLRRAESASRKSLVAGAILIVWIIAEALQVRTLHALQLIMFAVGVAQVALALRAPMRDEVTERAMRFLSARRVAFVGLSSNPQDFSHVIAKSLREHGVEVVPINPRHSAEGVFARVVDAPAPITVALLMVHPSQAESAVRDCVAAGVKTVWFHRGAGAGSASPDAVALAEREGLEVISDACPMMFLDASNWMHAAHRWSRGHASPLVTLGRGPAHSRA